MFHRRLRRNARLLTALLGFLALALALGVWGMSFLQAPGSRQRIHEVSSVLAVSGAVLLILRLLFFALPETLKARRSPSKQRRDAIYKRSLWQNMQDQRKLRHPPPGERAVLPPVRGNDGSVLVVVLAVLAAVTALVLQVQLTARSRLRTEESASRRAGLVRAATDAARSAMQRLADDRDLLFDALEDAWARREETRTPLGVDTLVVVTDENRRFDLNNLARRVDLGARPSDEVVQNLLAGCGVFDGGPLVRALQDWTDADDQGGRESGFYGGRKPPYACPNRLLLSPGEIFDVDGWTRSMFARRPAASLRGAFNAELADCVTVLPVVQERVLPVNVNTAGRDVLLAVLGLEQEVLANAILSMRQINPIATIDAVQQLMEPALFAQTSPYLAVRSDYFRIEARAFADGASAGVRALAHRDGGGNVEIIQWMF